MNDVWRDNAAAWEQTVRSSIALGGSLAADDWGRPTECPGWSVHDQYAHLYGVEQAMLGEAPDDVPRTIDNTDVDVILYRSLPAAELVARLRGVVDRRVGQLELIDFSEVVDTALKRAMPYGEFMGFRAFDCWVHEQDIRRAVGRQGNLDAPAARCAERILGRSLLFVVGKRAAAPPGTVVEFNVTGPVTRRWRVIVGDDGRARQAEADKEPTLRLQMDWESFIRLGAGRCGPEAVIVRIDGDGELADRVLTGMAVTP